MGPIEAGSGKGQGRRKPAHCPNCQKWGVAQWQGVASARTRRCRFCRTTWDPLSWDAAKRLSPDPPPKIEITKNTRWKDKAGREWQVFENLHFGRYWALCNDRVGYAGEWTAKEIRAAIDAETNAAAATSR